MLSCLVLLLQVVLQSLNLPLHDDQLTLHFLQFLHDLVVLLILGRFFIDLLPQLPQLALQLPLLPVQNIVFLQLFLVLLQCSV